MLEGLRLLVEREPGLEVVCEALTLNEALQAECEPDVILADLMLSDARGADVVTALKSRYPGAEILVLTMVDSPVDVQRCLSAGARGYLLKEAASDELLTAIRHVSQGEDYLHPTLGAAMARKMDEGRTSSTRASLLTEREREVLRLLALGHTNSEVANLLSVATRTIEVHRARILEKLGLRTRAELVRAAIDAGLVELGERREDE